MEESGRTFEYTYSSTQRAEINSILKKYTSQECDKMEQLRQLDRSTTRKGSVVAALMGILSSLVLGFGMCCSMLWTGWLTIGIVIGVIGLAGLASVYPIYNRVTKKERERVAAQVIALANELMN